MATKIQFTCTFLKRIRKRLYRIAYWYAARCQRIYFFVYMEKYITKHIKLRTRNEKEYSLLCTVIDRNNTKFSKDISLLNAHKNDLIKRLYEESYRIYKLSRVDYTAGWAIDFHYHALLATTIDALRTDMPIDDLDIDVLKDIVMFSDILRKAFFNSEITAKAKVQEHWVERLPMFVSCLSVVYLVQLVDMLYVQRTWAILKVSLYTYAYVVSIYLVCMRVFQSISADTKKTFSELYYRTKKQLYKSMVLNENLTVDSMSLTMPICTRVLAGGDANLKKKNLIKDYIYNF